MINSQDLKDHITNYLHDCYIRGRKPSYFTFGHYLDISPTTVRHVCTGYYASGKPYTNKPHIKRVIDNSDFEMIREVFEDDTENPF